MTRYRSKNPAARARQDAVFSSMRRGSVGPLPQGRWRIIDRHGVHLTGSGVLSAINQAAQAMGPDVLIVPVGYPLTDPKVVHLRPRREEAMDLERSERRRTGKRGAA
jgi:hypothetical protein